MSSPTDKVIIFLRPVGDAPRLDQERLKIAGSDRFARVVQYLQKKAKLDQPFVYLRESFSPSLDEKISTLYEAYGNEGRLVINYSRTPAWG